MQISVITAVYNCEKYIEEMINSILNQSFQDWEMIIIDDASTDDTWRLISKFSDNRIIKIQNKFNKGLTYNLNKALSLAKGDYVVRIDGDDIAYPSRLEKQIEYMDTHLEVVLSGCWMKLFGKETCIYKMATDSDVLKVHLLFGPIVYHPTFIIRKSILDKYEVRYDENLIYAQDYNLEYQLSKYGKITNIPNVLMMYRIHDSQISVYKHGEQIKCANYTRKQILHELGIYLTDKEFEVWERFCLMKYHTIDSNEIHTLQNVAKDIITKNKAINILPHKSLQSILMTRLSGYIERCNLTENSKKENKVDIYHPLFLMMCEWVAIKQSGEKISVYFEKKKIYNIAIYGMGEVGRLLIDELSESNIHIKYGIDRDIEKRYYEDRIKIVSPNSLLENVDAVIVTPISCFDEIKNMLLTKINCPIISLADIIVTLS